MLFTGCGILTVGLLLGLCLRFRRIKRLTLDILEAALKLDCELAAALKSLGAKPLFVGKCKDERVYECYWTNLGLLSTRPKPIRRA